MKGNILAVMETGPAGEPTIASLEVLAAAGVLAEGLGCGIAVATAAVNGSCSARELAGQGAGCIYEVRFKDGTLPDDVMAEAAWTVVQAAQPSAVLFPDTDAARLAAARVASRMGGELLTGCALLKVRDGIVRIGRSCLSGKAFAEFEWQPTSPVVLTVAAGAFSLPVARSGDTPRVIALEAPIATPQSGVTVLREVAITPEAMGVTDAEVLVAGGAGVGGPEGFELLVELARRLGGTVAASRVAVDRGWIPSARQVGLTGKTVSPRLYLAFGISGAPQHIAGIRSAGKVVAINCDARAPIFQVADLAVVADLNQVVAALLERLPVSTGGPAGE